jgi:hypothetical protein
MAYKYSIVLRSMIKSMIGKHLQNAYKQKDDTIGIHFTK